MKALATLWMQICTRRARIWTNRALKAKARLTHLGVQFETPEEIAEQDPLSPARGIVLAVVLAAVFWAVVFGLRVLWP